MAEISVFHAALAFIAGLATLVLIWMMAVNMIGGHIMPLVEKMNPNITEGKGITKAQYETMGDHLWTGLEWFFYAIIGVAFFFIAMKLLYERESTSISGYGGGG